MTAAPATIPVNVDNAGEWARVLDGVTHITGQPTDLKLDLITGLLAGAVPLLFATDAHGDMDRLRGTFTDQVVAQCARRPGSLRGMQPTAVSVTLVGTDDNAEGRAVIRVRLVIMARGADGSQVISRQFWGFQVGALVTNSAHANCPNCGAPIVPGELVCEYCTADIRGLAEVPLAVSELKLY